MILAVPTPQVGIAALRRPRRRAQRQALEKESHSECLIPVRSALPGGGIAARCRYPFRRSEFDPTAAIDVRAHMARSSRCNDLARVQSTSRRGPEQTPAAVTSAPVLNGRDRRAAASPAPSAASGDGNRIARRVSYSHSFRPAGRGHRSAMPSTYFAVRKPSGCSYPK